MTKKRFQAIINIGVPRFWEKLMVITFVGHSKLYMTDCLVEKIENTIFNKISGADKIKFYCGGYGDFDNLCLKACHLIRQSGVHCEIVLVPPISPNLNRKKLTGFCKVTFMIIQFFRQSKALLTNLQLASETNGWLIIPTLL